MTHIIQGNPSYKISIDDIDLDYFFRNIHLPKNGLIKPLWTNIGYKQNDYYEFEVITEKKNNVDSEIYYDHNLICESYICHICNINVPKMYQKEHKQTTKHKVYLEIADKSLDRSRKHINEEFNYQKSVVKYDCYFCQSCCTAVATELKGHHEKTPGHLISVQHDDLLKELLKYYLDRDNVKLDFDLDKVKGLGNLNQINSTESNDNESKKSKLKQKVDQSPNVVSGSTTVKTEVISDTNIISIDDVANKVLNFNIAQCDANKSIKSKNNTEITVNTSLNSHEAQTLTKDNTENIEVNGTMTNNKISEAALDNSNNQKAESDQIELTITKRRRKKKVKVDIAEVLKKYYDQISLGHKVKLVGDDLLEIESINGDIVRVAVKNFHAYKETDGKMRCNLCNLAIDDVIESHMFSECHMSLVMAPIKDQNCVREYYRFFSHCILCNEVVQDFETHIFNNKNHKVNLEKAVVVNETPTESKSAESDIVTLVNQNMSGKTYCEICEVHIGSEYIESHTNGTKHCENYDKKYPSLNNLNNVKKIVNKQNINELLSSVKDKPNEMTCKICKVKVTSKTMDQHLKGNNHVLKHNILLYDNKMQIGANGYYCDVCEVNVNMDNLVDHVDSRDHVSSLKKLMTLEHSDHFLLVGPTKSDIYCRVCEVSVANKLPTIDKHVASRKHQNNFNVLLDENQITQLDLGEYYCIQCNELLCENEISHIKSYKHMNAITKSKIERSPDNLIKIHPHMQTTANDKQLKCKVCHIPISSLSNSIEEHVKGKNHIKNYNKILEKFTKIDEDYFCKTCNASLKDHLIVDHTCEENKKEKVEPTSESKEVKINRDKPMPDEHMFCRICKVSFQNDPNIVEKHNNSEGHLENCSKIMKYNRFVDNKDNYFFELSTVSESMCSNSSPLTTKDVKKKHPASSEVINSPELPNISEIHVPETLILPVLHEHMEEMDKPGSLLCRVCNVPVPNNAQCVDIHVKGLKHKNKYDGLMKDNNLNERANCFYCGFCEILLSKNVDLEHVFSEEHKMKMVATTKAPKQTTSVQIVHYLMEETEQTGHLQCKLCKINIVDHPLYLNNHLKSLNHIAIYNEFVEKNRLVMRDDDTCLCKFCNEVLAKNTEYEHCLSKKHRNSMSPNKYMCNICNVAIPNNLKNIEEHLRGMLHQSKLSLASDWSN